LEISKMETTTSPRTSTVTKSSASTTINSYQRIRISTYLFWVKPSATNFSSFRILTSLIWKYFRTSQAVAVLLSSDLSIPTTITWLN
jgi:hypothetical protein